jgi:hypothetical protein
MKLFLLLQSRSKVVRLLLLPLLPLFLSSCATTYHSDPRQNADRLAAQGQLSKRWVETAEFKFLSYQKLAVNSGLKSDQNSDLHLYIEGDGRSYITSTQVSPDPTPRHPLALQLASRDPHSQVVYLARPCQYMDLNSNSTSGQSNACEPKVWTTHRFTEKIIASMNEAISKIKQQNQARKIHLIGFSGGAAIATLIAARRNDVASLRTVAGDLDHERMSKYHGTSPLAQGSLNPSRVAKQISSVPQHHFAGEKDRTVPPFISEQFVQQVAVHNRRCVRRTVVLGAGHHELWEKSWGSLLEMPIDCQVRQ